MVEENKNKEKKTRENPCTTKQSSKKRNRKEVAIFGNYRNYYGYRVGQDLEEDPRIKMLNREWFEGKKCLDIGCNSGLITIAIAKKFCCQSILGVDIDGDRIEDARWTLRKVVKTNAIKLPSMTPKSADVNGLQNQTTKSPTEMTLEKSIDTPCLQGEDLFDIVSFQKGNFVQNWRPPEDNYDTILCLSVTKWIHLNWGDEGLITLFWKVWKLLQPGGVFVLEPQPWSSYQNNRLVSETAAANYKTIQIPPQDFQDILLDKIGFRKVENLTSRLSGSKSGFNRPILAFWK
ncbi:probable RNA methyltransferase At5g51130 isoform X1 [Olea europaea var. sylvestris]|uniref:RNA methyltransferase n=2 Tax=Olea europaea subsp. europaea TaxID=158383 RepID=A0A8S0RXQ6_OLEEU|nr:probable RNA methyltransferase At5g51130 isoform X1 [Olea europaea var. sylvestris]CAA2984925.1 probable RNA methyltransferase At5g51130 [Olea europaea subsp. europaea]